MVNITIAGDFCPQAALQSKLIERDSTKAILGELCPIISSSNYAIVNLESPILGISAKPINKCGPNLKSIPEALGFLRSAGFKCCTLANNHFYDYGDAGIKETISFLNSLGLDYVGGGDEYRASISLKKIIGKLNFEFINCCEHEFSIAEDGHGGSNPLNPIHQYYAITEARKLADFVIVIVHGGTEHYQLPSPRMQEIYRFFIDIGADVVVNHHQHCFSGYEIYNGKPIFYGLGNFLYDHPAFVNDKFNQGILLKLLFSETDKSLSWELIPFHQCNGDYTAHLLCDQDFDEFNDIIARLNEIISDENALNEHFSLLIKSMEVKYKLCLEPFRGRFLRHLYRKGLLPSTLSSKRVQEIINYVSCESHREKFIQILKQL